MGMRRRTRRRALVAGAAIAHHRDKVNMQQDAAEADAQMQQMQQYAPPPVDTVDQLEHLAQLHASGVLTDDEFAAAKAQVIGG
jgi:hypothetical protein